MCVSRPSSSDEPRGHVHVEAAGADGARGAHQPPHGRDEAAREEQRGDDGEHDQHAHDADRADAPARGTAGAARRATCPAARSRSASQAARAATAIAAPTSRGSGLAIGAIELVSLTGATLRAASVGSSRRAVRDAGAARCARGSARGERSRRAASLTSPCVEDRDVRDVGVGAHAVEHRARGRALSERHEPYSASSVMTASSARARVAELAGRRRAIAAFEVEDRDRDRGKEDEADREQVELGEQSHAHRRQVEHRRRVRGERRHVPAHQEAEPFHASRTGLSRRFGRGARLR